MHVLGTSIGHSQWLPLVQADQPVQVVPYLPKATTGELYQVANTLTFAYVPVHQGVLLGPWPPGLQRHPVGQREREKLGSLGPLQQNVPAFKNRSLPSLPSAPSVL